MGAVFYSLGYFVDYRVAEDVGNQAFGAAGIGYLCLHIAGIAAAVDGTHTARCQGDGGKSAHRSSIVAAEEGTDVVDAGGIPLIVIGTFYSHRTRIGLYGVTVGVAEGGTAATLK